ncbi:MAG: lysostaphin resistance A-like protein, partial [Woeseiaceae bacterium]
MSSDPPRKHSRLWHGRASLTIIILLALGLTVGIPQAGVIGAFVIAIAVSVIARKHGSFRDMGFRAPASWPKLLGTTLVYGVVIQLGFTIMIEPLMEHLTGEPVDISVFDGVRGDFGSFLVLMAIGWISGGFLEELTFRGFIVGRVRWLLGSGVAATWLAVLVAAVPFGIAHLYQGVTGMVATGMIGFVLGAVYVYHRFNLWYAVFTHGFINTVGIIAIYMDI